MNIPNKDRIEWFNLVTGNMDIPLNNFVLQMKVDQAKKAIHKSKLTTEQAIDEIHSLCEKYKLAVSSDIKKIFNLEDEI